MKVILLPGMDGTGLLFKPLIDSAPCQVDVKVIQLLQQENISYEAQALRIVDEIETTASIIVAESYSGMIAIELLKMQGHKIKHVVFVASFITPPSILSKYGFLMPTWVLNLAKKPNKLVHKFFFGRYLSEEKSKLFSESMSCVDAKVLKSRLKQIASLKVLKHSFDIPCTYIRANDDNLVSSTAVNAFRSAFVITNVYDIEGTHFLLQTNPVDCWKIILDIAI